MIPDTEAKTKARIIASAAFPAGNDSVNEQWVQANETMKKLFWFKHAGYRYFTNAALIDPDKDANRSGLFLRPHTRTAAQPRLMAAAWARAVANLANAKPVPRLMYSGPKVEVFGFARSDSVIITAWTPQIPADTRTDKRSVITLRWPDSAPVMVQNLLGQNVTRQRLTQRGPGKYDLLLNADRCT